MSPDIHVIGVKVRRRSDVARDLFGHIDPDEVRAAAADPERMRQAHRIHHAVGGPAYWRTLTLFGESDASAKSVETGEHGVVEHIHYVAPARSAGTYNYCPHSTPLCRAACLFTAGRGGHDPVRRGREARNRFAEADPVGYLAKLYRETGILDRRAMKSGKVVMPRLNGTSDIHWEEAEATRILFTDRPNLSFRDYTKASPERRPDPDLPNYRLARSVWTDSHNHRDIVRLWEAGHHVSVLVDNYDDVAHLSMTVDASKGDHWLLRDTPTIGCLTPKGKATSADLFSAHGLSLILG